MRSRAALAAALAACLACAGEAPPPPDETILWAWERREDLSFLKNGEARVALLVATFTLEGDRLEIYGRRQPLKLPPGLVPIPVVRIETRKAQLDDARRRRLVDELARRADRRVRPALQIDFDAKESERAFYRALLAELAERLGRDAPISITALVSWCFDDLWLAGAPVAEAVPMLFDMGKEGDAIRARLAKGQDFREPLCRQSYGLDTNEPWPPRAAGRTIYLFSDRPWKRELLTPPFGTDPIGKPDGKGSP